MANATRFAGTQLQVGGTSVPPAATPLPPAPTPNPPGPGESQPTYPDGVPAVPDPSFITPGGDEGTAVDTLPLEPSHPLALALTVPPPIVFGTELDYETLVMQGARARRAFQLRWNAITLTQKDTLVTFFNNHRSEPWLWTAPDDTQRSWKLRRPDTLLHEINPGVWNLRADVMEVLAS